MGSLMVIADAFEVAMADEKFAAAAEASRGMTISVDESDAVTFTAGDEIVTVPFADDDEFADDAEGDVPMAEGAPV
tara:strand:+ start:1531 stop:1758 length:228 start_codon:yes stop_codon:yes gene_type:complete